MPSKADAEQKDNKGIHGILSQYNRSLSFMVYIGVLLLSCVLLTIILTVPFLSQLQGVRRSYQNIFALNVVHEKLANNVDVGVREDKFLNDVRREITVNASAGVVREDKFLEVPQIVWGLNNQKIALARAALTARKLNRTLVMPKLSASLFYKETDLLQPMDFDRIFSLQGFNSRCDGFVQMAVHNDSEKFVVTKGNGRRWTAERDLAQLEEVLTKLDIDRHEVVKLEGKHPFLWHDHWPVRDYARVFECLALVDNLAAEVAEVVSRLRKSAKYVAVHMRIEKDWMIHCLKLETRARLRDGRRLRICSSKEEIMRRVGNIPWLEKPCVVYLAVADDLLEDGTLLEGWGEGLVPFEKKRLGVQGIYAKYPYLVQAAIDYEVCLKADVFVGNSFSTFSGLVALQRTVRMKRAGAGNGCGYSGVAATYAYNVEGPGGGPRPWAANMSDSSLAAVSYGSNEVSCM